MKKYIKNIIWLTSKQLLREHVYSLAEFLLSLIFSISIYIKFYYFILPEVSSDVRTKLSGDVLSITLSIMMLFGIIVFILISLIYNNNRTKTFGIMRGVGARTGFIFSLLFCGNIFIMLSSAIVGLTLSIIFFNPGAEYLERMYSISVTSDWNNLFISVLITLAAVIVISAVTSLITSFKILHTDPYEVIRSRE